MMGPNKLSRHRDHDAAENAGLSSPSSSNAEPTMFAGYEMKPRMGKDRFVLSVVLHAAAGILLVEIASLPSAHIQPVVYSKATPLIAPVPPAIVKKIVAPPQKVMAKLQPPRLVVPQPPKVEEVAKVVPPPVVQPELKKEVFPVVSEVVKPAPPKKEIITNTFASGSSVPATLQKPAHAVQTGGFGDEQGVRGTSDKGQLRVAALGAFDLPAGPGQGNGTGGARGAKGTVASSGFGDGTAGPGNGDHGRKGRIAQAGFDQTAVSGPKLKPVSAKPADITPVEILFKPRPVYTDEARRLHVEGEVLMAVTFTADGRLGDFRVVRGLGHGLDEAAQRAAAQIKFHPAKQNGQPLDSTAYVHIVFELAE